MPRLDRYERIELACDRFVDACLRRDDSMFTPGAPVWSLEVVEDAYERFVGQPDVSADSFEEKLERQLKGAPDRSYQLMAELFFVLYMIAVNFSAETKRLHVERVLAWMHDPVDVPPELEATYGQGIVRPGTAFHAQRWRQISYFLEFARYWKRLPPDERTAGLRDPWKFREIAFGLPDAHSGFTTQEALLFFVHPDTFEPIVAREAKRKIASTFAEYVKPSSENVDAELIDIRAELEPKYGVGFDWYVSPLKEMWQEPPRVPPPPPDPEPPVLPHDDDLVALAQRLLLEPDDWLETVVRLLAAKGQVIFYGPPGTGKTFVARELARHLGGDDGEVAVVQLHPSYAYEDFVEGYRPAEIHGQPGFRLEDGPLKRLAAKAVANPRATHVLVIDEINRGNVAKVLGELYFLLEYRDEEIALQYSATPFTLPRNLWIIGTMNSADRSVGVLDNALRRRFYFLSFLPDEPPVDGLLRRWLEHNAPSLTWVADRVDRANELLPDSNAAIGPSYFMRSDLDDEWVDLIWKHGVIPYVEEQLFGQAERLEEFDLARLQQSDVPAIESTGDDEDAAP